MSAERRLAKRYPNILGVFTLKDIFHFICTLFPYEVAKLIVLDVSMLLTRNN